MADRTNINFSVTLEREPSEDDFEGVREIVAGYSPIDLELDTFSAPDGTSWHVGGFYFEGVPDEADGIADELHEAFPDALEVRCWDDPKYEWLGTLTVYRRGEEQARTASCNSDGTAVYTAAEILKAVEDARAGHDTDPVSALSAVIGSVEELAI